MQIPFARLGRMSSNSLRPRTLVIALFLLGSLSGVAQAQSVNTAFWRLDEGAGTIAQPAGEHGGALAIHHGEWAPIGALGTGSALRLDGTKSFAVAENLAMSSTGDLTVSFWLKLPAEQDTARPGTDNAILSSSSGSNSFEISVFNQSDATNAGRIKASFSKDRNASTVVSSKRVNDAHWHHITLVRDTKGKALRLYIDGVLDASDEDIHSGSIELAGHVFIGARRGREQFLTADIDEIGLWSLPLNAAEVVALTPGVLRSTACNGSTSLCDTPSSSIFAISHDYLDPDGTVLYRVSTPELPTTTNWGDKQNGFFYRTSYDGGTTWKTYTPFNGVGVNGDGNPTLRPFSFIVEVPTGSSSLLVQSCAQATVTLSPTQTCSVALRKDEFTTLPSPTAGTAPFPVGGTIDLSECTSGSCSMPGNGVYAFLQKVTLSDTVPAADYQWVWDHLVWFDASGKAYLNNISTQGVGVLTLGEAAFLNPADGNYYAKFGDQTPIDPPAANERYYFFYSTKSGTDGAVPLKPGIIHDKSTTCKGLIEESNITDKACASPQAVPPPPTISPTASIELVDWSPSTTHTEPTEVAGISQFRQIAFELQPSQTGSTCGSSPKQGVANPLGVSSSTPGQAYNIPNYVINSTSANSWQTSFSDGLYYILPTGFGNCTKAPFCDLSGSTTAPYFGYVPQYYDANENGGPLNGLSTNQPTVSSVRLADEYAIGSISDTSSMSLVYFDTCGYGHEYTETAAERKTLPPPNQKSLSWAIQNSLPESVVVSKECCASLYQDNKTITPNELEPPQQIGDGFGVFIPRGATVSYETLFGDELFNVYSAATGTELFKLRLSAGLSTVTNSGASALYDCTDTTATAVVAKSDTNPSLTLGGTGTGAISCTNIVDACPWPMLAGQVTGTGVAAGYTSCTLDGDQKSSFLLGVGDWAKARFPTEQAITLMAWGAGGHPGNNHKSCCTGGSGGAGGFASTVISSTNLEGHDALYAYVGNKSGSNTYGGSSSVLAKQALSSLSADDLQTLEPGPYAYLVAGGGGGGGDSADDAPFHTFDGGAGGRGNKVCNNSTTVAAITATTIVSSAGGNGAGGGGHCGTGKGGNPNGKGKGGSSTGTSAGGNGLGGWASSNQFKSGGSLVFAELPNDSNGNPIGKGGPHHNYGGGGGGGWGGGGAGDSCSGSGAAGSGGGGGGTFAMVNTAHDPTAPSGGTTCTGIPASPVSGYDGAIQLVYAGDAIAFRSQLKTQTQTTPTQCLSAASDSGDVLTSINGWRLTWENSGALIIRDESGNQKFGTTAYGSGAELCFQTTDGNFVINANGKTPWATGAGGTRLAFTSQCEVSLLNASNAVIWSTKTSCS